MPEVVRDYSRIRLNIAEKATREERMQNVVDALWDAFGEDEPVKTLPAAYSWVGFYLGAGEVHESVCAGAEEMILSVRRNKPACSPIGLHGACGQSHIAREILVVRNVKSLGEGYVACDPRDVSELVVPLLRDDGVSWGVFDADSFFEGAFTEHDAHEVWHMLKDAGLVGAVAPMPSVRVV